MKTLSMLASTMILCSLGMGGGCSTSPHGDHAADWSAVRDAVAVVVPTAGNNTRGVVSFSEVPGGVRIVADIEGLKPNGTHAFHVHDYGDVREPSGKSAGGHYNPEAQPHGRPDDDHRHAGDLGNLEADQQGHAHYERVDAHITVAGLRNAVIGRAVIIHAGADKFIQPTGGAGARIGIGVIGIAKP